MKVVLLKSVDNLGQAGQSAEVKRGYFRNFLEPRGLALLANSANLRLVEARSKKLEAMVAVEKTDAEAIREKLNGQRLEFQLRAGDRGQLFGSITARDVVEAVREKLNVEIERRRLDMDNLKTLGDHNVRVRIYPGVIAILTVHIERLVTVEDETEAATQRAEMEAIAAAQKERFEHEERYGRDDDDE